MTPYNMISKNTIWNQATYFFLREVK